MRSKIFHWPAIFILALTITSVHAADVGTGFEDANRLYEQGKYADAAAAYDKLLQSGSVSSAVYFNRGNALFKLGQVGRAIACYREAERLSPRDADVRANLQFARTQARGGVPYREDFWSRYLETLTLNEWTCVCGGAVWVFFTLLALTQWRAEPRNNLRVWLVVSGLAVVASGVSLWGALANEYFPVTAIVVAGEADVRSGPLDESPTAFKVRDGIEMEVLDRKDDWLEVVDSAQRLGWLRQSQVLLVEPSRRKG